MSLGMRFSAKNNRLTSVSIDYREPETAKCLTLWVQHGREAAHLLPRHLAVQLKSNSIFSVPYSPLHKLAHLSRLSYPLLFCIMHLKRHGCQLARVLAYLFLRSWTQSRKISSGNCCMLSIALSLNIIFNRILNITKNYQVQLATHQ